MFLVNTRTLELEEFESELDTTYCTLSHRWLSAEQEVSFQDIASLTTCRKKGVFKLRSACKVALSRQFDYIWVDTCCIDKSSSAALSESINRMWKYYETGDDCLAFLADFTIGDSKRKFEDSSWFTRSWTLQELLAPMEVTFFDAEWREFGTRTSMSALISSITGITEPALHDISRGHYSVAQRMSWAARREATRIEDYAYSLMGLFNINMPMLYGEGWKAFKRLQEEIIKQSDDQTIFAWTSPQSTSSSGLLALNPAAFSNCGRMIPSAFGAISPPFSLSSRGINIELGTSAVAADQGNGIFKAILEVVQFQDEEEEDLCVGIYLDSVKGPCNFRRRITYQGQQLWTCPYTQLSREFFHKQPYCIRVPGNAFRYRSRQRNHFQAPTVSAEGLGDIICTIYWNSQCEQSNSPSCNKSSWLSCRANNPVCTIDLTAQGLDVQLIQFGFDDALRPVCFITDSSYIHNNQQACLPSKRSTADIDDEDANDNSTVTGGREQASERFLPDPSALKLVEVEYLFAWPWNSMDMRGLIPHREHNGCWAVIGQAGQDLRFFLDAANARSQYVSRCAEVGNSMKYKMSVSMVQHKADSDYVWHLHVRLSNTSSGGYRTALANDEEERVQTF